MGRPKTTGKSHNKNSSTYTARKIQEKPKQQQQRNIFASFRMSKSADASEGTSAISPPHEPAESSDESIDHEEVEQSDDESIIDHEEVEQSSDKSDIDLDDKFPKFLKKIQTLTVTL